MKFSKLNLRLGSPIVGRNDVRRAAAGQIELAYRSICRRLEAEDMHAADDIVVDRGIDRVAAGGDFFDRAARGPACKAPANVGSMLLHQRMASPGTQAASPCLIVCAARRRPILAQREDQIALVTPFSRADSGSGASIVVPSGAA